jgi:hypothetical protein
MASSRPDDRLTRYLVGDLSEAERAALEQDYFADPAIFERLERAETGLVDDYVRGRLAAPLREAFERHYLAQPRLRERVELARILIDRIDQARGPDVLWYQAIVQGLRGPRLALAALALLLVAVSASLAVRNGRLRADLARTGEARAAEAQRARDLEAQLSGARSEAARLGAEADRLRSARETPAGSGASAVVALRLTVPGMRTPQPGAPTAVRLAPGTSALRIELALGERAYPRYRISLKRLGGPEIYVEEHIVAAGEPSRVRVSATVPAERLSSGDYLLTLAGERPGGAAEDVSQLPIRVERK